MGKRIGTAGVSLAVLIVAIAGVTVHAADQVALPSAYKPYVQDGSLAVLYTFDATRPGWALNLAKPGTGDLNFMSRSAYGSWRGGQVLANDTAIHPQLVVGRDGLLSALRTGTANQSLMQTGWLPDFEKGYTLSFWIRVVDHGHSFNGTVMHYSTGYKNGWRLEFNKAMWAKQGRLALACGTAKNTTTIDCKPFLTEVWHHVAIVADKGAMSLYVDGQLSGQTKEPLIMPLPGKKGPWLGVNDRRNDLQIASKWYSKATVLDLGLDEFAGFGRALNADQITSLYQAGKPEELGDESPVQRDQRLEKEAAHLKNLNDLDLQIPLQTWGYFDSGQSITLTWSTPAGDIQPVKATYTLTAEDGNQVAAKQLPFPSALPANVQEQLVLPAPGLYQLTMQLLDIQGRCLKAQRYPLGITVAGDHSKPLTWLGSGNLTQRPEARAVNVGLNRVVCDWRTIEPAKDAFDWSPLDNVLLDPQNRDTDTIVCVTGIPGWVGTASDKLLDDNGIASYQRIWDRLLARYAHVKVWEVWDPTDKIPANQLSIAAYRQLLATAADRIHAASGDRKVLGGACWQMSAIWVKQLLENGGGDQLDILGIQTHFTDPATRGNVAGHLKHFKRTCAAAGYPKLPIFNTGIGCEQAARPGLFPESGDHAMGKTWPVPTVCEQQAATWMIQSMLTQLAQGVDHIVIEPGIASFTPSPNHSDGQPGIKGLAIAMLGQTLGSTPTLTAIAKAPKGSMLFAFTTAQGTQGVIAFATADKVQLTFKPVNSDTLIRTLSMIGQPVNVTKTSDNSVQLELGNQPVYFFNATH